MAIRDDFAPGEVLTSADLNDTFGSKLDASTQTVLQVVSTAKTDTSSLSTAATSWTSDIMTVSITPSSTSSKILVIGFICGSFSDDVYRIVSRIMRGGTAIGVGDSASNRIPATAANWAVAINTSNIASSPFTYLDSPATTSATSYSVQLYNTSNIARTIYVNRSSGDPDNANTLRPISTITVMEVNG